MFLPHKIESLGDIIGPAFVILFFFVLPIVRAVRESMRKKEELAGRGGGTRSEPTENESEMRRKWEELLRGETAPSAPPAAPPIPRAYETIAPPAIPVSRADTRTTLAPVLDNPVQTASEDEEEAEGALDEEALAQVENDRRLREERERRQRVVETERTAPRTRAAVGTSRVTALEATEAMPAAASREAASRERLLGSSNAADRRAALRRAVVAREVLGPPLALRRGHDDDRPWNH